MSLAGVIGGIVMLGLQMWLEYMKGAPARKAKADAIARKSVDELHVGTERLRQSSTL